MKFLSTFVAVVVLSSSAFAGAQFPTGPNLTVTPGALCTHPDSYRYPEHIPYCERDVLTQDKNAIIANYDHLFGYTIESMNRQDFKIDHFIPLCAGGANDVTNLWPQHKTVYVITDPLEPLVCNKMAAGTLTQAQAVDLIRAAKTDLSRAPGIIAQLQAQ